MKSLVAVQIRKKECFCESFPVVPEKTLITGHDALGLSKLSA